MQPWRTIEEVEVDGATLALRQRGERDFLLTVDGRVLMSSMLHRSEDMLATLAAERLSGVRSPRVLTAGLGLGFTLRALLDALGAHARIEVSELHEAVTRWCAGPLAPINGGAARDARVKVRLGDVMDAAREAVRSGERYDAIVIDLMEGPSKSRARATAHLYGPRALETVRAALTPTGVYAVWGEDYDPPFLELMQRSGLEAERVMVGRAPRHVVYLGRPAPARARPRRSAR